MGEAGVRRATPIPQGSVLLEEERDHRLCRAPNRRRRSLRPPRILPPRAPPPGPPSPPLNNFYRPPRPSPLVGSPFSPALPPPKSPCSFSPGPGNYLCRSQQPQVPEPLDYLLEEAPRRLSA